MIFLIIAHDENSISLLKQAVDFLLMDAPRENGQPCDVTIESVSISEQTGDTGNWFQELSATFQKSLDRGRLTVLVSRVRPYDLNPLAASGWEAGLAMLILTFPEVRWMFGTIKGYVGANKKVKENLNMFREEHGVTNLFHPDLSPIFDGMGLRDWVRWRAFEEAKGDASYLPRRQQAAFSLDDESRYSYLHAYTAYRFGFRAIAVNSAALATHLLGANSKAPTPLVAFEDIYISFVDGNPGMSWLNFNPDDGKGRAKEWPRLEQAINRIFVTSGQRLPNDDEKWKLNDKYIEDQRANRTADGQTRHLHKVFKPYAGIFRFWEESELKSRLHQGVAKGFHWPPPEGSFSSSEHGHSSPGALLAISEKLIERAEKLLLNVPTVQHAVQGAVWATDALEILGGRTPTIAIEALKLKHHFEVVAECQFTGVEDHIQLDERFGEIERDVKMISRWYGESKQEVAAINAEMKIVTDLMRVFREFTQFEEEQLCLKKVRKLQSNLWFQRHKPWGAPIYWIRWYVESLLGSMPWFLVAICVWIFLLALGYDWSSNASFPCALKSAFISFIAIQPNTPDPNFLVTMIAMLIGVTHLGILISHLYSLVSRK